MSYNDEITEKRRFNRNVQAAEQKPYSSPGAESPQLSPMPALEELTRWYTARGTPADRATISFVPRNIPDHDLSRYPTIPLTGLDDKEERRWQGREKKRRARHRKLLLLTVLLVLVVLCGLLVSGLYALETNVLAPLAQFFQPVGVTNGSIEGRSWNLLLLGSDNDNKFTFPEVLTQVMMVAHIDPFNKSVFLLSIPRDSWVSIPGQNDMHKIDQAFELGASSNNTFDAGVSLARRTVEQDYGIPIDRYAWIGLSGFARVIDTLGGIDIDVTHPLLDDNYPDDTGQKTHLADPYAVKRLYLAPGPQHLNGEQALEFVRSRHADLVGDIGRTQRQQEILTSLKKKLNVTTIFNHLTALFHDLTGKVYTDLNENEMFSLATFVRALPFGAVQRLTLGPGRGSQNYGSLASVNGSGSDGSQQVILPDCANIQPVINRIFNLGDAQSCQVNGGGTG